MDRTARILSNIDVAHATGLELGPLTTPIVRKGKARIFYADHMSAADLRTKYAHEPVELDKIVAVDYVLGNGLLRTAVGTKKFDYVIASHVIEHVPDTVRWLQDVASVLKPGGVLSLAIPDKRYTFDITRQDSRPADIVGAYADRHTRAPSSSMYDFAVEYRTAIVAPEILADPLADPTKKKHRYSPAEAWDMTRKNAAGKEYVDSHCHVFTPYSFMEILRVLYMHNLCGFELVGFHDTAPNEIEFFVSLRKTKERASQKLIKKIPKLAAPPTTRELERRIQTLEKQVHDVLTSTSWRVTKPLRRTVKAIRRQKP